MRDTTPEQMMIRALQRVVSPDRAEERQALVEQLEACEARFRKLRGGWWNLPDGMRRRLMQERGSLFQAVHGELLGGDRR